MKFDINARERCIHDALVDLKGKLEMEIYDERAIAVSFERDKDWKGQEVQFLFKIEKMRDLWTSEYDRYIQLVDFSTRYLEFMFNPEQIHICKCETSDCAEFTVTSVANAKNGECA